MVQAAEINELAESVDVRGKNLKEQNSNRSNKPQDERSGHRQDRDQKNSGKTLNGAERKINSIRTKNSSDKRKDTSCKGGQQAFNIL